MNSVGLHSASITPPSNPALELGNANSPDTFLFNIELEEQGEVERHGMKLEEDMSRALCSAENVKPRRYNFSDLWK